MSKRTVEFSDHHDKLIEALVRSGRYKDAEEVVREGLRLVERREREDAAKLKALREAVTAGVEALERGEYKSFASFEEMERYLVEATDVVIEETSRD